MSLKIHVSSTKKAQILEFLKINKSILRIGLFIFAYMPLRPSSFHAPYC